MNINEEIIKLWNDDVSAREIGILLGKTKNSIIGIVGRLRAKGFPVKVKGKPVVRKKGKGSGRPREKTKIVIEKFREISSQRKNPSVFEIEQTINFAFQEPSKNSKTETNNGKTIMQLLHNDCRYITSRSEEGYVFCAKPSQRRQMCKSHYVLCYVPSVLKKAKKRSVMKSF